MVFPGVPHWLIYSPFTVEFGIRRTFLRSRYSRSSNGGVAIFIALENGHIGTMEPFRKLRGGSSLCNLLAASGIKHNIKQLPPLSTEQILRWADAYFRRHRTRPSVSSGQVVESHLETWSGIDGALRFGRRGLPTGSSLPQFLNEHRGLFEGRSRRPKPIRESERLRLEDIVEWGKDYRRRTGNWPNRASGRVSSRRSLTWLAIDSALKTGCRGLEGGSSLARLFRANSAVNCTNITPTRSSPRRRPVGQ